MCLVDCSDVNEAKMCDQGRRCRWQVLWYNLERIVLMMYADEARCSPSPTERIKSGTDDRRLGRGCLRSEG